jgi:hypothetical protein
VLLPWDASQLDHNDRIRHDLSPYISLPLFLETPVFQSMGSSVNLSSIALIITMPVGNPDLTGLWKACLGLVVFVAIRVPHDKRSKETKITESRKGTLERTLLVLMGIGGFLLPLAFVISPVLSFADYSLRLLPLLGGIGCLGFSLWLFHRSHLDLGTNWSNSLELRENHRIVVYGARINERIHEVWQALAPAFEVKELYDQRYGQLMRNKGIEA